MLYGYSLIIINRNTSSAFATVFAFEAICEYALFLEISVFRGMLLMDMLVIYG